MRQPRFARGRASVTLPAVVSGRWMKLKRLVKRVPLEDAVAKRNQEWAGTALVAFDALVITRGCQVGRGAVPGWCEPGPGEGEPSPREGETVARRRVYEGGRTGCSTSRKFHRRCQMDVGSTATFIERRRLNFVRHMHDVPKSVSLRSCEDCATSVRQMLPDPKADTNLYYVITRTDLVIPAHCHVQETAAERAMAAPGILPTMPSLPKPDGDYGGTHWVMFTMPHYITLRSLVETTVEPVALSHPPKDPGRDYMEPKPGRAYGGTCWAMFTSDPPCPGTLDTELSHDDSFYRQGGVDKNGGRTGPDEACSRALTFPR
ncbi:hypothetical protein Bbelb_258020 [Branchiostoma belcheri]|nr:hypothetical protein Bbelb_258020 [Branchiostoma belcheri]